MYWFYDFMQVETGIDIVFHCAMWSCEIVLMFSQEVDTIGLSSVIGVT